MSAYRIWALEAPFNKRGFPVMGTFGSSARTVIVIEADVWRRMCAEIPQLGTTEFEVGAYRDETAPTAPQSPGAPGA